MDNYRQGIVSVQAGIAITVAGALALLLGAAFEKPWAQVAGAVMLPVGTHQLVTGGIQAYRARNV